MENVKKLFLFLAVFSLLSSGVMSSIAAFADSDDDQHDGKVNKKNRVWTGDGPPLPKLGKVGDLYIDNNNDAYNIYKKTGKNLWTDVPDIQGAGTIGPAGPQGETGPQGLPGISPTVTQEPPGVNCSNGGIQIVDSFFDVFFVCNGLPGIQGSPGPTGTGGSDNKKLDCYIIKKELGYRIQFNVEHGCSLQDSNLNGLDLAHVNLSGADLFRAYFQNTNLSNANFSGAHFYFTVADRINISNADFTGAKIWSSSFLESNLSGANLSNTNIIQSDFAGANLSNADFTGAKITNTSFLISNLSGANLSNTEIINPNLTGTFANPPCTGNPICDTLPLTR